MPQAHRWVDLQRWVEGGLEHALPPTPEAIAAALHEVADDWSVELIVEVGNPRVAWPGAGQSHTDRQCVRGPIGGRGINRARACRVLPGGRPGCGRRGGLHLWRTARRYLAAAVSGGRGSRHRGRPGLLGHGHRGAVHRALGPHLLVGTEERPGSVGAQSHWPAEDGGRSWPLWKTGPSAWLHPPKPRPGPATHPVPVPADRVYAVARGHHRIFGCAHTTGSSTVAALVCSPNRMPRTAR